MELTIRLATREDYPTIVSIGRNATANYGLSVDDLEWEDKNRAPDKVYVMLVAIAADNQIVGTASYMQPAPKDDPQRFFFWIFVPPPPPGQRHWQTPV